ncbi:MAG: hypothetical protein ABI910_00060 [Gemmatimonadota bacterium]
MRRSDGRRRRALLTSAFDVSLISATQLALVLERFPSAGANSRMIFVAYVLTIGATCLRWDARATLMAGLLALVLPFSPGRGGPYRSPRTCWATARSSGDIGSAA